MNVSLLDLALWSVALTAALSCGYLLLLTLLSAKLRVPIGASAYQSKPLRFDIVVPAHNEQLLIERVVGSLQRIDWPSDCFRVLVVANNCTDNTVVLAREAGACVIEHNDNQARGKGYALQFAFQFSRSCNWADAVLVVDADSDVSPNLLSACAARINDGAHAVQVHYGVRNPDVSWRTRLMTIALGAFHRVRSRARERMKLSCGIRGNGWCVTHTLLSLVPYRSFSLAEDIEYGIEIGLSGYRVHYADEAYVNADMVSGEQAARTQRQRWEHGRFKLIREKFGVLMSAALRRRSAICFDLVVDLAILPLSYIALGVLAVFLCAGISRLAEPTSSSWSGLLGIAVASAASLLLYVLRGWQLSGIGARGLVDLLRAPFFVAWKVAMMARSREPLEWVRTKRRA
jgi:1,2-diacylglycerol 3-beta-glucosyltransferase